jgi:hypothetical protein
MILDHLPKLKFSRFMRDKQGKKTKKNEAKK